MSIQLWLPLFKDHLGLIFQNCLERWVPLYCLNLVSTVCGSVGATLPTGQLSNIPWRRTGVKYTNNEAYFDVIEEIDAIIDKNGTTVIAEIQGYVSVHSWLF